MADLEDIMLTKIKPDKDKSSMISHVEFEKQNK